MLQSITLPKPTVLDVVVSSSADGDFPGAEQDMST